MLKRFYSKRSGFTLVEIIIAFAVFAIMASMVCQILQLSVAARRSNNIYQRELAEQESVLTVIEKSNKMYSGEKGKISLDFGGKTIEIPYDVHSAKPDAEFAEEGLNYFVANVNYQTSGEIPATPGGDAGGASNTGSQMSRMDTRITGTGGISYINIMDVVKDENTYAEGDKFAIPEGHTRYFIRCNASDKNMTLKDEDVPYSQYRLYFYSDEISAGPSDVLYTDASGKKYKKDVYKAAEIVRVGYLCGSFDMIVNNGLNSSRVSDSYSDANKFTIDQTSSNCVRIGSPFKKDNGSNGGLGGKGQRFDGTSSSFYVEFVGDPKITTASFGHNGEPYYSETGTNLGYKYSACPVYMDTYNTDGTPKYQCEPDKKHVNIYGASLFTRHYE